MDWKTKKNFGLLLWPVSDLQPWHEPNSQTLPSSSSITNCFDHTQINSPTLFPSLISLFLLPNLLINGEKERRKRSGYDHGWSHRIHASICQGTGCRWPRRWNCQDRRRSTWACQDFIPGDFSSFLFAWSCFFFFLNLVL